MVTIAEKHECRAGRTAYAASAGENKLRQALAGRYTRRTKQQISPEQILCFPGTQTALFAVIQATAAKGDEVVVGDLMYATYASVMAASGAEMVTVPLRVEKGFRIQAQDIEAKVSPDTSLIFLNTPHNPTGAVLTEQDITDIGAVAKKHDLWLLVDEVYDEMIFSDAPFCSPLSHPALAEPDRRVVCITGDGGAQFSLPEMMTARDENLSVIFLVWNNFGFREIAAAMSDRDIAPVGCRPCPPGFKDLARACAMPYVKVENAVSALERVLKDHSDLKGPVLMEIQTC